jgi:hypothetical protein
MVRLKELSQSTWKMIAKKRLPFESLDCNAISKIDLQFF